VRQYYDSLPALPEGEFANTHGTTEDDVGIDDWIAESEQGNEGFVVITRDSNETDEEEEI